MTSDCCDCFLKIFIFLLIIGPIIAVTSILFISAVIIDSFILVYFALIGWLCELKIWDCHDVFLVEKLRCPWKPLFTFYEKIKNFFGQPLTCSHNS